jgi:peptidoglycan/LPS O-acetylase OafA/YrhL
MGPGARERDRDPKTKEITPASPPPPQEDRFTLIDGIRGIAALGIASYHIHRYGPVPKAADDALPSAVESILDYSWIGVQFFFVIAGFVAAHSLRSIHLTLGRFGNFALRRLVRLGLPYWVTVAAVLAINVVAVRSGDESLSGRVTWLHAAAQFLFLQDILGLGNISAGLWFVAIDLQFGLLFAALVGIAQWLTPSEPGGSRRAACLLALTVPLALLSAYRFNLNPDLEMWIHYFFHLPVFGAIAWWALEGRVPRAAFWLYAAAMLLALTVEWRLELAVATVAAVTLYSAGRQGFLRTWLSAAAFQYLGRISYSLFLVHYPVSWIVLKVGHDLTGAHPVAAVGWLLAALAASLGAAHLFYVLVESPARNLAQRMRRTPGGVTPRPSPLTRVPHPPSPAT